LALTRQRTAASRRILERLRRVCLALPETIEKQAWGEPTWRVKGKMFAQLDDHHHGAPHCSVWLPMPMGVQETLIEADPKRFFRPAYVGHKGWVAVVLDGKPDLEMVAELVREAYRLTAPPRLAALAEAPAAVRSPRARSAKQTRRR
jgi:hypothetical protein